jgi:hypothetical protein
MVEEKGKITDRPRSLYMLAMANTAIWVISIVALVLVIQRAPGARGLFVILAGGTGVSISLLSMLGRAR